ncbi:NAD(P)-dependent oxidoreductase [Verrucomicrobiales bacterium BCK34]|nr:NAD(P)-dependent oxidoreductase [Verrucomicrobiales bacterium BCK34]
MSKTTPKKKTARRPSPKKIGFVGVGRMGANMARHLNDLNYNVTAVFDVFRPAANDLAEELDATAYTKLADVTANADIIFTVVTDDAAMKKIFLGKKDSLFTNAAGKTFINCATLSPEMQKTIATGSKRRKADCIEACMASSISHARNGELYLMIGAEDEVFKKNKKLLEDLSLNLRHIGKVGKAAEVKALVNMVMNINTAGLAEGLGLAKSLGHDLKMICEVFSQTGANSRVLETDAEDMIDRDHDCWFSASHAAKDSGIAGSLAKSKKLNLPLNEATTEQYKRMIALDLGELDKSGIAELTFPGRTGTKKKTAKRKSIAKKKTAKKKSAKK